jgi:shikimate dehydrogenase
MSGDTLSRYAVIGNPVSHSKSPLIHTMFAEQTGQSMDYTAIQVTASNFSGFVNEFFAGGGKGLNVTLPYKEKAYLQAVKRSERAEIARAVNTLYWDSSQQLCGDNTDGIGLLTDLKSNHAIQITGKRLLILGAGGAVRGILGNLIAETPAEITLLNRTLAKAESLKTDFANLADIEVYDFNAGEERQFDIIINGTSAGLANQMPPLRSSMIAPGCCFYDMVYGMNAEAFIQWAKNNGASVAVDGLGMLVEQAAESFFLWRGIRPQTAAVIRALRNAV